MQTVFNRATARDLSRSASPLPSLPGVLLSVIDLLLVEIGRDSLEKVRLPSPTPLTIDATGSIYSYFKRCSLRRRPNQWRQTAGTQMVNDAAAEKSGSAKFQSAYSVPGRSLGELPVSADRHR
jgi:hypothetical protein